MGPISVHVCYGQVGLPYVLEDRDGRPDDDTPVTKDTAFLSKRTLEVLRFIGHRPCLL